MTRTGIYTRLATYRHLFYRLVKIGGEIYRLNHRRNNNALMLYGQRLENRESIIRHLLILYGTSHEHVVIAFAPVFGNTFHETVYSLGEEIEQQVFSNLHHLPAFSSPRVSIFQ